MIVYVNIFGQWVRGTLLDDDGVAATIRLDCGLQVYERSERVKREPPTPAGQGRET